jgi:ABC-type microcin C transport system duplicated ATPase subunit YejF
LVQAEADDTIFLRDGRIVPDGQSAAIAQPPL